MKKLLLIIFLAAGMQQLMAQTSAPRNVLIEEFTGTWCGYCPNAMDLIEQVRVEYPTTVISIANHGPNIASDSLGNNYTTNLTAPYGVPGFPGVMVDRADWSSLDGGNATESGAPQIIANIEGHNVIEDAAGERFNAPCPVNVNISSTYNSSTRSASVTVTANFVDSATGDMRITCLLVEDSVIGDATFDQENYLGKSCASPYSGSAFYGYPCKIPTSLTGKIFTHRNVVRYNLAGTSNIWGFAGVIPNSVTAGQQFSKTFTSYTLPAGWNDTHMKVVAFISLYNSATGLDENVLNAQEVTLGQTVAGIPENPAAIDNITFEAAYPNPFNAMTNIKVKMPATQYVTINVYDVLGNQVATLASENLTPGEHTFYWSGKTNGGTSLSSGLYLIRLQTERQSLSQSIVLSRK